MGEPGLPDLPGYQVFDVLGQGGYGVVYRARQLAVGREVAVKIDNRPLLAERDRRRFVREVTAAGALSGHPHVADVYDAGVLPDGRPFMVLELCPGGSLADRLRREGRLPAAEVRDIGVRIADALAAAHAQGVLHRDVKPGNILIDRFGLVALSDFGLAALPAPGREPSVTLESLTPAFAPPEAFQLGEPTEAGDVYALAATLYTLLNGRPPRFPEDGVANIWVILALHGRPIPDIPGVPPRLTAVLRHGMATDPRDRLPGAAALRDALAAVPLDDPPRAAAPGRAPRPAQTSAYAAPDAVPYPGHAARFSAGPEGSPGPPHPPDGPRDQMTGPAGGGGKTKVHIAVTVAAAVLLLIVAGVAILNGRGGPADVNGGGGPADGVVARPHPTATGDGASPAASAVEQVRTTTDSCPAAQVAGADAACVVEAECWGCIVELAGEVQINRAACEDRHVWETFAVAPLPADGTTWNAEELGRHPVVKRLCSRRVLLASRIGAARRIPEARWLLAVVPPTKETLARGVRTFRCVGAVPGRDRPGTYFRPIA